MPRFFPSAAALLIALSLPAAGRASVTKDQALDAIRTFEANAGGGLAAPGSAADKNDAVARASNTILKFTLESDLVIVDLGAESVPWCDVKKGLSDLPNSGERGLLLAAYLCGSVKAQLESGRQDPNPYVGWVAMLRIYRAVKLREGVTIPEAEALLARRVDGTLEAYAADAARRSAESLRSKYGPAEGSTR